MIKIHEYVQIGSFHTNHCEDVTLCQQMGSHRYLLAVMDGCTMGTDSHFAATLTAKLLRKIAKSIYYKSFIEKKELALFDQLHSMIRSLFQDLVLLQNQLQLPKY